eukprot:scaffold10919_cov38-Cyclotella_meneghiniana.AAC.2
MEFIPHNHHNTPTFESQVVKIMAWVPTSHTKIEWVQTDSAISYQLNPSNLSLQVYTTIGPGTYRVIA